MTVSRPPTPPSRPARQGEFRFETITSPCESIAEYRPGGYHPVSLGDTFNSVINRSLDIWCFGCLVFELLAGQPLFSIGWSRHPRDKQLLYFNARIGPLPDKIFNRWETSSLYFTPDRTLFNCAIGGVPEGRGAADATAAIPGRIIRRDST